MNALEIISKIQKISKYFVFLLVLLNLCGAIFGPFNPPHTPNPHPPGNLQPGSNSGSSGAGQVQQAMTDLCNNVITVFGAAIILMIVLAAIVYTAGQIMGAETRARANVWATAMITGAIIGAIIYVITPYIMATLIGADYQPPCTFTISGA